MKPLTPQEMRFVTEQAAKLPQGWHAAEQAPNTYEELIEDVRLNAGHITVWSGGSDRTVYGDPTINHAFRAWHDSIYVGQRFTFDLEDERRVALVQRDTAFRAGLTNLALVLYTDVVGQALHFQRHGTFPEDQVGFITAYLRDPLAALREEW